MLLMLNHFTMDLYAGLMPVLYPLLATQFMLNLQTVGFITLAYSGMASVSQPLFGWIADRYGTRWMSAALIWTALGCATIGFAPSFPLVLLLAGAAGLGSGAFHPCGALNARALIPAGQRNTAMSVYVTGGTLGVALGPLIGGLLFTLFGMRGTAVIGIPVIFVALWLMVELRRVGLQGPLNALDLGAPRAPVPLLPLLAVILVMMSRAWTVFSIEAFIPIWYQRLGY